MRRDDDDDGEQTNLNISSVRFQLVRYVYVFRRFSQVIVQKKNLHPNEVERERENEATKTSNRHLRL